MANAFAALAPVERRADRDVERRVDALLRKMTLDEKLQQLALLSDTQIDDAEAAKPVGGVFSLTDPVKIARFQRIAVEQSRLHIPILFAFDTIHGYRTIFPIPLGAASSFDPSVAMADHRIGAFESAAVGLKQIYSPMVDVSHEPRWGRISEAAGEDPYLNSVMAAARVKGAQGTDYGAPDKVAASVKHLVAYGQPEGGRDYDTTDMSLQRLWNVYHADPDEGPCGHGVAADGRDAARKALDAGTDSEMVSTNFRDFGRELVASRLRGFERVRLARGAKKTVTFALDSSDFGFYANRDRFVVEPGRIDVYAGDSSSATQTRSFTVSG
jgi:beta-glucosidase-like glycosyl hydrolase